MKQITRIPSQKNDKMGFILIVLMGLASSAGLAADITKPETASATELVLSSPASSVDVTIYGNRFAQVEESRTIDLKTGHNSIQLNGVSASYRPNSLRLISVSGPGHFVYKSATYQPANLSRRSLLAAHLNKVITVRNSMPIGNKVLSGTLKTINGDELIILLDSTNEVGIFNVNDVVAFPGMPAGLTNTPALMVEADVDQPGKYTVDFLYETGGLGYLVKHAATYDDDNKLITSLESGVVVSNQSGTTFNNVRLRLISGKVTDEQELVAGAAYDRLRYKSAPGRAAEVEEADTEAIGDQKLYSVPGEVSLNDGQSRQIPLFIANNVPVDRDYVARQVSYWQHDRTKSPVSVQIRCINDNKHGLGKPLPGGMVKVYQYNASRNIQLTGTTSCQDTANGEELALNIGESSDIKVERVLLSRTVTPNTPRSNADSDAKQPETPRFEDQSWQVTVENFKSDRDVKVKVQAAIPEMAEIKESSQALKRTSAGTAEAAVSVPRGGKVVLTYKLRIKLN